MKNTEVYQWKGIKNDETKKVSSGYLFVKFLAPVQLLNINANVINAKPVLYETGQIIGFSIKAQNRKEAISVFERDYQIQPEKKTLSELTEPTLRGVTGTTISTMHPIFEQALKPFGIK